MTSEVTAALAALAGVDQAVLIDRADRPGDKRAVAYVTASAGATVDPGALRGALAEQLPAYLVPAAVVVIDALPMLADGQLDTHALPVPDYQDDGRYRETEVALAGIYAQVLGVEDVGV